MSLGWIEVLKAELHKHWFLICLTSTKSYFFAAISPSTFYLKGGVTDRSFYLFKDERDFHDYFPPQGTFSTPPMFLPLQRLKREPGITEKLLGVYWYRQESERFSKHVGV